TKATANGTQAVGSTGDAHYTTSRALVIAAARTAILVVPGSGSILGIALYSGAIYAARNAADGLTAAIYKSSASGWTAVKAGLIAGGTWRLDVANFSGTATSKSLFGCDGRNNPFWWDGTTYTHITGLWDSAATSTDSVAIGTGAKTFVLVEANRDYTAGDAVTVWDAATAANWMAGTVTTWTSGTKTLVLNITSVGGSGTKTAWHVGMTDYSDKPYMLREHKDHMMYAYPNGQLRTSDLGDPTTGAGASASLFGLGDEITNLLTLKSGNLAIYCANSIYLLTGSNQLDWVKEEYSASGGATADTAIEVAGVGIHIDAGAIKSLQATQAYGNYETSSLSSEVGARLSALLPYLVACVGNKAKQQYRVYASNGDVLVMTVTTPNAVITPKDVSPTVCNYNHDIACVATGELSDGSEAHFFGTTDGYVMHERSGTSFDGQSIPYTMRLTYNSFGSPANKKRFRKLEFEISANGSVTFNYKQHFDNQDGFYASSANTEATAEAESGLWDVATWDEFVWASADQTSISQHVRVPANVAGIGRSMSLTFSFSSDSALPHTIHGILYHYTPLGMTR
ncbi:MAG: hypothetical protein WC655_28305, partial [Candidatus Hydrogenedentales bacterium]